MADAIHLHPTAPLAPRVLLPGDPGRALRLAQALLEEPKMFNHHRGLWGYTGRAGDGALLTIQSTGMGGPSAAIVVTELAQLGGERLVRIGTCGALDPALALGDLVIASDALSGDGTSRALGAEDRVPGTSSIAAALERAGGGAVRQVSVASSDLFYDVPAGQQEAWRKAGAAVVEMETATLFALAARRGFEAGALLLVSDIVLPERRRIDDEALHAGELQLGALAADALGR